MNCTFLKLAKASLLILLFGGSVGWAHPYLRISGRNVSGYGTDPKTKKTIKICSGMNRESVGHIEEKGEHFVKLKMTEGPCKGQVMWVLYKDIPRQLRPGYRQGGVSTEAATCANGHCGTKKQNFVQRSAKQIKNLAGRTRTTGVSNSKFTPLPGKAAGECSKFITPNGELGDYGQRTLAAIDKIDPDGSCFRNGNLQISTLVCPKYKTFSKAQQERFLVYLFGSIAHDESTCRPNVSGDGGASDGLFQLEYSNRKRYTNRNGRGEACKPGIPWNTRDLNFQFECTASTMKLINCRPRNASKPLGNGSGNTVFWSQLRHSGGDISNMLKRFPGCR